MTDSIQPLESGLRAPRFSLWLLSESQVGGHAFDPADFERRLVVEMLIDGHPVALGRADLFDADLEREGVGDGCHGFLFSLDPAALRAARTVEVRLANSGESLGPPLKLDATPIPVGRALEQGAARWIGGLRINGWLGRSAGDERRVRALIDGAVVAETLVSHWTHIGDGRDAAPVRGYDIHLPERFADGRAHFAEIRGEDGRELPGSPCPFVAFPDGLARFLDARAEIATEKLRGEVFDRRFPQSLPFDMFAQWREKFEEELFPPAAAVPEGAALPKIGVALIGERDVEASIASLQRQQDCDWIGAALEGGEGETGFPNAALREFLDGEAKACEVVVFALSGTCFEPRAIARLAQALALFPAAPTVYCDFTVTAQDGGEWPVALTAFDYERMLEQGCGALIFALRVEVARQAAAAGVADLFRLFNFTQDGRRSDGRRGSASPASAAPVHAPGFMARLPAIDLVAAGPVLARASGAHLQARGAPARIHSGQGGLLPAVRIERPPARGKVSILIPTRDRVDLLKPCIDTLFATVDVARHEWIVLDNDSADPETLDYFERLSQQGARVVRIGGPFNFARIVNKGASIATGAALLLLNNDIEALSPGWLEEMLGRLAEPDVGAVGATLLWPSRVVQHGGVTLGPSFDASHAFGDRIDGDAGYGDLLRVAHEVSAATGACLLTERRLFLEVGGLNSRHFPVNYNDVDYCLKLRARGLRVVQTPHAKLLHRGSASRGRDLSPDAHDRLQRELRNLRAGWGEALADDPYYNPLLSLDDIPFTGLAWPPRSSQPRQNLGAKARILPPGF